ncbi:MAG: hypothetical protein R3B07_28120 [Polyangiaceae bacterium]
MFAGNRAAEWEQRMAGASYLEIPEARRGSAAPWRIPAGNAGGAEEPMPGCGSDACSSKAQCIGGGRRATGSTIRELEMLGSTGNSLPRAPGHHSAPISAPTSCRRSTASSAKCTQPWIRTLRQAAAEGLVVPVDAGACEDEAFSLAETRHILELARSLGIGLKLHTEQFTSSGGTRLGVELGATSVIIWRSRRPRTSRASRTAKIRRRKGCPAPRFTYGSTRIAPGRALVDAGVPVAPPRISNPGSSPTPSMPLMIALLRALRA